MQPLSANDMIRIELNKLEERNGACRVYLVLENTGNITFSGFKLDLVTFDKEGIITGRLAVETAPLRALKTTVKLFDIPNLVCADMGRIIINDVIDCHDGTEQRSECITFVESSSRSTVPLVL
jgi:hypothetical protein